MNLVLQHCVYYPGTRYILFFITFIFVATWPHYFFKDISQLLPVPVVLSGVIVSIFVVVGIFVCCTFFVSFHLAGLSLILYIYIIIVSNGLLNENIYLLISLS